ncbi:MAG: hypothetical protein WC836_10755 [Desulfobacula sp.]
MSIKILYACKLISKVLPETRTSYSAGQPTPGKLRDAPGSMLPAGVFSGFVPDAFVPSSVGTRILL